MQGRLDNEVRRRGQWGARGARAVLAGLVLGLLGAGSAGAQTDWAQVRVVTDPPGASVTCDDVERETTPVTIGQLAPGAHLIIVRKPGHRELRQTITVVPGQKAALNLALEPLMGLILIHSVPSPADVEVDGAHRGRTPLLITDLLPGRYRLKATAAGYQPREVELAVKDDRIPQWLKLELPSDSAKLVVSSTPTGATVTVNGIVRGTTPCEVDRLPAGENKLVVALAEHRTSQENLKLQAGDVHTVTVALQPLPGALSIVLVPPGAQVFVGGQLRGQSPVVLDTLEPGEHEVRVEMEGHATETRTVTVDKGATQVAEFQLTRNAGQLEIVSEPPDALVAVDGTERGVTVPGDTATVSAPFRVEMVATGSHQVVVSRKGYHTVKKTVQVEANQTVAVRLALKRHFVPDTQVRSGAGAGEVVVGCVSRRLPNGDLELETKPGIFVTIKAADILAVEALAPAQ